MNLMEYQGKELFRRAGIAVPRSAHASTPDAVAQFIEENPGQWVVKAQVLMGGRGKAGKIKMASNPREVARRPRRSWRRRCRRTAKTPTAKRSGRYWSRSG